MEQSVCPTCHFLLSGNFYFCPNCGKEIKTKNSPIPLSKQIGIYMVSIFLPPLGLMPGIKYFLRQDEKTRRIGFIAIVLTILSSIITIWITMSILNQITKNVSSQAQQYQDLGL